MRSVLFQTLMRSTRLRLWLLILGFSLTCSSPAKAGPATDFFVGLCDSTRARAICDIGESLVSLDSLITNGGQQLVNALGTLGQGFVTDAINTLGGELCVQGVCLNDAAAGLKRYLNDKPSEFFVKLYEEGQRYYLSNLAQKLRHPSTAEVNTPTYFADNALRQNPNVQAEFLATSEQDRQIFKERTEIGALAAASSEVMAPNGQPDQTYAKHAQGVLMPATGFIADYKARAKAAVSSREVMQIGVELEADRAGLEVQSTLEISKRLQQVAQVQILTNAELAKLHSALVREQDQKALEFQAKLEAKYSKARDEAVQGTGLLQSAGFMVQRNANPNAFDAYLGGF